MKRTGFILLYLLITLISVDAKLPVKFLYDLDFLFYFDNREYDGYPYQRSQTLFGARLSPEIGVGISDSIVGDHKLMAGASYIQPIGADYRDAKILPTLYYQYKKSGFSVHLGLLPFYKRIETLPDYLMYDSIAYYHPNIQGALFQYESKQGLVELMCDWRGMWSSTTREAFRIVLNGRYEYKVLFVGGFAQMNHLANYAPPAPHIGVCDDILINPYIGVNLGNVTPLDSFSIRAGYLLGIQRDREAGLNYIPQGGNLEIFLRWRMLGLKNTTYYGESQNPLYPTQKSLLNQSDPFYVARFYNRTEVFVYIFNNSFVNCYLSANFHVADGTFSTQQQVIAQFRLDGIKNYKQKKKLKSIFGK